MNRNDTFLDEIWDLMDLINIPASKEEKIIITKLEDCEKSLLLALDDEQNGLFLAFLDTVDDLHYLERRSAFKEGVKLAFRLFIESFYD